MNPYLFAGWTLAVFLGGIIGGYHLFAALEEVFEPYQDDNEEEA